MKQHSTDRARMRRPLNVAAVLALATLGAACGGDDSGAGEATGKTAATVAVSQSPSDTATPTATSGGAASPGDAVAGTPMPQPLPERTSVTITTGVAIEPFAAPLLADYFGEFEKENLDVDIEIVPPSDGLLSLTQGDVQMQITGFGGATLNARASGLDIRYVATTHAQAVENHEGLWVRNEYFLPDGSPDASKIRGSQIALGAQGAGAISAVPLSQWLATMDLTLNDVTLQPLQGADIVAALDNGSIAAGHVLTPGWKETEQSGCCRLVTDTPPIAGAAYLFPTSELNHDRDVSKAIMRAIMRTQRTYLQGDYHSDPEVLDALVEVLGVPAESLTASPPLEFDPDLGFDATSRRLLEEAQGLWLEVGGILSYTEPLDLDTLIDTSSIDEILAE